MVRYKQGKEKKVVPALPVSSDGHLFPTSAAIVASTYYCTGIISLPHFYDTCPQPIFRPHLPPPSLHPFSTLPRPALTLSTQPLSRDSLNRPPPVSPYRPPSSQPQAGTRLAPTTIFVRVIFLFFSPGPVFSSGIGGASHFVSGYRLIFRDLQVNAGEFLW